MQRIHQRDEPNNAEHQLIQGNKDKQQNSPTHTTFDISTKLLQPPQRTFCTFWPSQCTSLQLSQLNNTDLWPIYWILILEMDMWWIWRLPQSGNSDYTSISLSSIEIQLLCHSAAQLTALGHTKPTKVWIMRCRPGNNIVKLRISGQSLTFTYVGHLVGLKSREWVTNCHDHLWS